MKGSAEGKAECLGILAFTIANVGLLNPAYLGMFSWKEDARRQSTGVFQGHCTHHIRWPSGPLTQLTNTRPM